MYNAKSVRAFLSKMADSSVMQGQREHLALLHNSHAFSPRPLESKDEVAQAHCFNESDFGVGLPPLANC